MENKLRHYIMSSISLLDRKLVLNNNNISSQKKLKLKNNLDQKNVSNINNKSKFDEVVIYTPQQKTLTYSKSLVKSTYSQPLRSKYTNTNNIVQNTDDIDDLPQHPDGPCYAELLGFGHSLKCLTPVFHAIKRIVTDTKKTISGVTSIANPVNTFMHNLSDKVTSALNSINPFLKKSSINSELSDLHQNIENIKKLQSEVNSKLFNLHGINSLSNKNINHISKPWTVLKESKKSVHFAKTLQNVFKSLKHKIKLHDMFLKKIQNASYSINGVKVPTSSLDAMLKRLALLIPNFESRQLISSYAHEGIFNHTYSHLMKKHPSLLKSDFKPLDVSYDINQIDKDTFNIVATNTVKLNSLHNSKEKQKHHSIKMRSLVSFSKNSDPSMQNAFFMK